MLNRFADKILDFVLPHERAAAACGSYYMVACTHCVGGKIWYKRCQDCTSGRNCSPCNSYSFC